MRNLITILVILLSVNMHSQEYSVYGESEEEYSRAGHGAGSDCPPHSDCWCAENPNRCKGDYPQEEAPISDYIPYMAFAGLLFGGVLLIKNQRNENI